jgi:hypothetical protein
MLSNERFHIQFLYFVFLSTRYLQRLCFGLSKYQIIRCITWKEKKRLTRGINLLLIFYKENFHWSEILLNLFCRLLRCSKKKCSEAQTWRGFANISPVTVARTPVANCNTWFNVSKLRIFPTNVFINDSCDPQHIRATLCLAMIVLTETLRSLRGTNWKFKWSFFEINFGFGS